MKDEGPNSDHPLSPAAPGKHFRTGSVWRLSLICIAFLLVRLPAMLHQPGGMDEDWFAVPGWTVAREGIPRVPYAPERDRESFFWRADTVLFALPPAYHYWQAPFFLVFPAGYGTARLASAVAGMIAVCLVYEIGRRLLDSEMGAVAAAGLYSLSRVFYFPATTARPDMLCGMFGLAAVLAMLQFRSTARIPWLLTAGVLLGLAGLTHPFALLFAIQFGVWILIDRAPWTRRLYHLSLLVLIALATFSLWLPLILRYPEIFREQFFGNVLTRALGSDSADRESVWSSVPYQTGLIWEHAGPLQFALMLTGLVWMSWAALRPVAQTVRSAKPTSMHTLLALTVSALALLVILQGTHPTKGYWCYPGALLFLGTGGMVSQIIESWRRRKAWAGPATVIGLIALMVPGSGMRATAAYLKHWNDPEYNAPAFIRNVLSGYPAGATYIVDPAYVFNSSLMKQNVLLAVNVPVYFHAEDFRYDYLVVSRYGLANDLPEQLNARRTASYGSPEDPFACYVEIYRPREPSPDAAE